VKLNLKKLKPGLNAFYAIQPGNSSGLQKTAVSLRQQKQQHTGWHDELFSLWVWRQLCSVHYHRSCHCRQTTLW